MNGQEVAKSRIARLTANLFLTDEGADVGMYEETPASKDYQAGQPSRFTGKFGQVTIELKPQKQASVPLAVSRAQLTANQ